MAGRLTTHVLDTARGVPAPGILIRLWRLEGGRPEGETRVLIAERLTNGDGRTDTPIAAGEDLRPGRYELVFAAGDYLRGFAGEGAQDPLFLEDIPIRFGISDAGQHYHVPLLLSPYAYSTYRGS